MLGVNVNIIKIDEEKRETQNPTRLTGAKFKLLKKGDNSEYTVYPSTGDPNYTGEPVNNNGELTFTNLPDGEYKIEETVMPAGYVKSVTNDIYFKVVNGVVTRTDSTGASIEAFDGHDTPIKVADITYVKENYGATFTVGNTPGVALPATGGPGTTIFYVAGSALLLLAIALLLRRKARDVIE